MLMRLEHPPGGGWALVEKRVGKHTNSVITALVFKKYLKMKLIFLTKPVLAVCRGVAVCLRVYIALAFVMHLNAVKDVGQLAKEVCTLLLKRTLSQEEQNLINLPSSEG